VRDALLPGDPADEGHDRLGRVDRVGEHRLTRLQLGRVPDLGVVRSTCTRLGSSAGYVCSTSSRMPELTAITASAASTAVFSTHDDTL
jgi:hypothetical protein